MGAIYTIDMAGVKVAMLFTPRLYEFRGREGVTFEHLPDSQASVHALYADVMYCAALNHWTLTHGGEEEFPHHRIDFHEYSVSNPQEFAKALVFAAEKLSGKSIRELTERTQNAPEKATGEEVKKKSLRGWITRLLRRSS